MARGDGYSVVLTLLIKRGFRYMEKFAYLVSLSNSLETSFVFLKFLSELLSAQ